VASVRVSSSREKKNEIEGLQLTTTRPVERLQEVEVVEVTRFFGQRRKGCGAQEKEKTRRRDGRGYR